MKLIDHNLAKSSRYPNMSLGYLGLVSEKQSLNSRFYAQFLVNCKNDLSVCVDRQFRFPQRIPKTGFFKEFFRIESEKIVSEFNHIKSRILEISNSSLEESRDKSILNNLCILIRLAMRYGVQYSELKKYNGSDLTVKLEMETCKLNDDLSEGRIPDFIAYEKILTDSLDNPCVDPEIVASVCYRSLVLSLRFSNIERQKTVNLAAIYLRQFLADNRPNTFNEYISHSMYFRGLSMWPSLSNSEKEELLNTSLLYAMEAMPKNEEDEIIKKENQITLYTTLSKWMHRSDEDLSKEYMMNIIKIDPYDSTGFTELALLEFNNKKYESAINYFLKATDLGSPSYAMNLFYLGESYNALGQYQHAENAYLKSAEYAPTSATPRLSLIRLDKLLNRNLYSHLVCEVLNSAILRRQLSDSDFKEISE